MQRKRKLNVLINNAAMMLGSRDLTPRHTADGLEITMATNHLGWFKQSSVFMPLSSDCSVGKVITFSGCPFSLSLFRPFVQTNIVTMISHEWLEQSQ